MGSSRIDCFPVEQKEGENSPSLSYHEIFDKLCPEYLSLGMSWADYWNGDPKMAIAFRKAAQIRNQRKNQEMWIQGLYIYEAMLDVAPVFHDFAKNPKPQPYRERPFALSAEEAAAIKEKEAEETDKNNQAQIKAWVERANRIRAERLAKEGDRKNG